MTVDPKYFTKCTNALRLELPAAVHDDYAPQAFAVLAAFEETQDALRWFLGIEEGDDVQAVLRKMVEARDSHYLHDHPNMPWRERQYAIAGEIQERFEPLIAAFGGADERT